jgi:hypothetical protein
MQRILDCTKIMILGLEEVQEAKQQILKIQVALVQDGEKPRVMSSCLSVSANEKNSVPFEDSQS